MVKDLLKRLEGTGQVRGRTLVEESLPNETHKVWNDNELEPTEEGVLVA